MSKAFTFRETLGSIPSGGSAEASQIQNGKEVTKDETLESRTRETRAAYCPWWRNTAPRRYGIGQQRWVRIGKLQEFQELKELEEPQELEGPQLEAPQLEASQLQAPQW